MEHLNFNEVLWVQHSKEESDITYKLCGQNHKIQTHRAKSVIEAYDNFSQLERECENSGAWYILGRQPSPMPTTKDFMLVLTRDLVNLRQVESVVILTSSEGCGVFTDMTFIVFKFKFKDGSQHTTQRQVIQKACINFVRSSFEGYGINTKWDVDSSKDESKNKTNEGEKTMGKKEKEENKPWFERVDASQVASVCLGKNSKTIVVKYYDYDSGTIMSGREIHFPFKTRTDAVRAFNAVDYCCHKQWKDKVFCVIGGELDKRTQFILDFVNDHEDADVYMVNLNYVKHIQIENKLYNNFDDVATKLLHFKFKNEHISDATIEVLSSFMGMHSVSEFLKFVRESYPDIVITERFTRESPKPKTDISARFGGSIECFDADGDPFDRGGLVNLDMDAVGSVALCGALGLTGLVLLGVLA